MSDDTDEVNDVVPDMMNCNISQELMMQIMAAKEGDPNRFQSYWEMDEEGIDEESMEEIQKDPSKWMLWAAENDRQDVVKDLLQSDKSLVNCRDADEYSPLHRASYNGHTDMVMLLLENGADIHAETIDKWRPLHSASRWNQTDVMSVLIQNGADVNAQTNSGQTALHLAASDGECRDALEILLMNKNIDTRITNSVGETAYTICRRTSENYLLFEIGEESVNKFS